ncbi:MAG: helix-turn-helix domain-containing protein [Bdellovibrionota bacterium]
MNEVGLETIISAPERISEVPPERIPSLLVRLSGLFSALSARLLDFPRKAAKEREEIPQDRLLTAAEAAPILGVTVQWLYRHAKELPYARKLSRKVLRFSEAGIRRHMAGVRGKQP